jgi:hypothetical protein
MASEDSKNINMQGIYNKLTPEEVEYIRRRGLYGMLIVFAIGSIGTLMLRYQFLQDKKK